MAHLGAIELPLSGVRFRCAAAGEEWDLPVRGLFYGIGHKPNSGMVKGQIQLDEAGYVVVKDSVHTNVPGVFAAGEGSLHPFPTLPSLPPPPFSPSGSADTLLTRTASVPAGDLHDTEWRQAITAAGSGCSAAIATERYLTAEGLARIVEVDQARRAATVAHVWNSVPDACLCVADECVCLTQCLLSDMNLHCVFAF